MVKKKPPIVEKAREWKRNHVVDGFWKAVSWIAATGSMLLSFGPDVANFAIARIDLVMGAFPELDEKHKMWVLLVGHAIVFLSRPIKQECMSRRKKNADAQGSE